MRAMNSLRVFLGLAMFLSAMPALAGQPDAVLQAPKVSFLPVYHISLRIHVGMSSRSPEDFLPMLREINDIWLSQAGICFEMEVVTNGELNRSGIDLWFEPVLGDDEELNGYYENDQAIRVRDTPRLGTANRPARYPAARTAAHELGHSLGLAHRQDSDDNLMRSKTYGWQLNAEEVVRAREIAKAKAIKEVSGEECSIVVKRNPSSPSS